MRVELILDGGQLGFGLEKVLDIGSKFYEKVFNFADRLKKKKVYIESCSTWTIGA